MHLVHCAKWLVLGLSNLSCWQDYSVHPLSGKERRLNLIVYLTPDWNAAWCIHAHAHHSCVRLTVFFVRGGGLQLWEAGMARLGTVVPCTYNTGVRLLLLLLCNRFASHAFPVRSGVVSYHRSVLARIA